MPTTDITCNNARHQPSRITSTRNLNTTTTPKTPNPHEAQGLSITSQKARTYRIKGMQG